MRTKKVIYNIISNFILQFVVIIYGLVIPKLIINVFGSNVNGLISSITQFLGYITLLESGFGPVVSSLLYKPIANKNNEEIANILCSSEKFFKKISFVFLAYIAVLVVIYPFFVNSTFNFIFTASLILIISISTFSEYYFGITYKMFLQAQQQNYIISIVQCITYIVNIIVVIVLIKLNCSIHIVKLITCIIFVIRPIFLNIYFKTKYKIKFDKVDKKYSIKNKWDGLAQHIAGVIHSNTDVTLLTIFVDLASVSIYSVYNMIVKSIKGMVSIFTSSVDATFGDMIARNELDNLNRKFSIYEFAYYSIVTIIYSCTMVLIVPFVNVYTKNADISYINLSFAIIFCLAAYIHSVKSPYNNLAFSAGKFKETRKGSWIEALSNLLLSLVLIFKFGLVGVALGTLISVLIRTIELVIYSNKKILKRNLIKTGKSILLSLLEMIIICIISYNFIVVMSNTYLEWFILGIKVFSLASIVVLIINIIFYKEEFKYFINKIERKIKK